MNTDGDPLLARPLPGMLPVRDVREPVRVLIASLAPGGAERIVLEWLGAEAARRRDVELAVLHPRRIALEVPSGIQMHLRGRESPVEFLAALARRWLGSRAPISVHLVNDGLMGVLWKAGLQTVPVVHNMPDGWRSAPATWPTTHVPRAIACADAVRDEMLACGCRVPLTTLRHRPGLGAAALDPAARTRLRAELGVGPDTLLVAAVGAFKPQKDYCRAIDVMAELRRRRDAVLLILGGVLDQHGLPELDRVMAQACAAGLANHLRLPGFVQPIAPWYAAADVLMNVSRYEGLSMAVREALSAGLPVVATAVGGQGELPHPGLRLMAPESTNAEIARQLATLPVRGTLNGNAAARAPRLWSLFTAWQEPGARRVRTLFVTANLNAGGAQRSLINLLTRLAPRHPLALAVCGESTQPTFASALTARGIEAFRPAAECDPFALAEALLAWAGAHRVEALCLWNVDPKLKLLLARAAPDHLRLVDVSPGHYAFEEMADVAGFGAAIDLDPADYYARLDLLVLKYRAKDAPAARHTVVIPNGVGLRCGPAPAPATPRYLVSGRIAPSKRLELVLAAFTQVQGEHPSAELHLAGQAEARHTDYLARLREQAAGLDVRFRGAQPGLGYLAEPFTAAVVLGTHQGSPNAVLEAMSAGIPVIANASGGTGEILREGETGWLLPEQCSADQLAAAMREAYLLPERAARMGAAGQAHVRRYHDLDAMAASYHVALAPEMGAEVNSCSTRIASLAAAG